MKHKLFFVMICSSIWCYDSLYAQVHVDPDRALLEASATGEHAKVVDLIKVKGANVNVTDEHKRTPLMYAALQDNISTVEQLLEHEPLLDLQDEDGNNALMHAVNASPDERITENTYKILQELLEHGANPTLRNKQGKTALDLVRMKKNQDDLAHKAIALLNRYAEKFPQ